MNIFAKRGGSGTKRSPQHSPATPRSPQPHTPDNDKNKTDDLASDAAVALVVQQCKSDPSFVLNAKQRRLVKRYQDRLGNNNNNDNSVLTKTTEQPTLSNIDNDDDNDKPENASPLNVAQPPSTLAATTVPKKKSPPIECATVDEKEEDSVETESTPNTRRPTMDDDDMDTNRNNTGQEECQADEPLAPSSAKMSQTDKTENPPPTTSMTSHVETIAEATTTTTTIDTALQATLDQLNSKQRRKLVRTLERGEATVDAIRIEAARQLAENNLAAIAASGSAIPNGVSDSKSDTAAATTADDTTSKKRRRPGNESDASNNNKDDDDDDDKIDSQWSHLPPVERMRRQEQRRMQQEAAAARAAAAAGGGVNSGQPNKKTKVFAHALNSERRRANRRKPKWETKNNTNPNEHDLSGYHMRKITGQQPEAPNGTANNNNKNTNNTKGR